MVDDRQIQFEKRMRRINKKHQKLAHGAVASVGNDGLIIARPRSRFVSVPWRGLLFVLVILMGLKSFLHASLGDAAYNARVAKLEAGTMVEQIGAYAMKADPVTTFISGKINPLVP